MKHLVILSKSKYLYMIFAFCVFFLVCSQHTKAQSQKIISGKVIDTETDNAISGIIVKLKGTDIFCRTDDKGKYKLIVSDTVKTIEFSNFQGKKISEVIKNGDIINIYLISNTDLDLFDMTLEELMSLEVVSASNTSEKFSNVPANMFIITAEDINDRGYTSTLDIFDDLPGMQVSKAYAADSYYANYWRGYRNTFNSPYLFMIDGLEINHAFYGSTNEAQLISLSSIERIEIVYGPVSSVYGANAFMGVINVITRKDLKNNGTSITASTSNNLGNYFIGDYNVFLKKDKFRFSFSSKLEFGDLNELIDQNSFEWTKKKYYNDQKLWGIMPEYKPLADNGSSPMQSTVFDFRFFYDKTELGFLFFNFNTGYGVEYPADKAQVTGVVEQPTFIAYLKHTQKLSEKVSTVTNLQYKRTTAENTPWIEGYNTTNLSKTDTIFMGGNGFIEPNQTARVIDYSTWGYYNSTWSISQNFDIKASEKISFITGIKYKYSSRSKHLVSYGSMFIPQDLLNPNDPNFVPKPVDKFQEAHTLKTWTDYGFFLQSKIKITEKDIINIGGRVDENSQYGTNYTFRGGYVKHYKNFTAKLLYGEAYQAPTQRSLSVEWSQVGGALDLKPEESKTYEIILGYAKDNFSTSINSYYVQNENTIINAAGAAKNLGKRNIIGLDYQIQSVFNFSFPKEVKIWAYYSAILKEEEQKFDANENKTKMDIIGDLSHNNFYFGITSYFTKNIIATLRGRYIGERKTIDTNPIDKIDSYFTLDANLQIKNIIAPNVTLGLKVFNLLDAEYFHPGVKSADSGEILGYWENGIWNGSKGWGNSKLPQPHRYFMASLIVDL